MKDINIANTPINAFRVFVQLHEKDCGLQELLSGFSDDTLRIYINTLKNFGVKISSPTKNNPVYSLVQSADFLNFQQTDYKNLQKIKRILSQRDRYKLIKEYNNFLLFLSKYTNDKNKEQLLKIAEAKPFGTKMHSIIEKIEECINLSNPILFEYLSPNSATNFFKILPKYFKIENSKIYIYCYDKAINEMRCLLLARVKSVKMLNETYAKGDVNKTALCRFFSSEDEISIFENYEVIEQNKVYSIYKIYYKNTFSFIQKILSLGKNCQVLEPIEIQDIIKQKLKNIGAIYEK